MIINIAHTKGGVGKSTLACNLAVQMKIPIIDLDMQKSSYYFNVIRAKKHPPLQLYTVTKKEEFHVLENFSQDPKKHIIIDSGGMDNDLNRLALIYADIIITPIGLSQVELLGLHTFNRICNELQLDAKKYILLYAINKQATRKIEDMKNLIQEEFQEEIMKTTIGSREIFNDAFMEGMSVIESGKNAQASEELRHLINEIHRKCKELA